MAVVSLESYRNRRKRRKFGKPEPEVDPMAALSVEQREIAKKVTKGRPALFMAARKWHEKALLSDYGFLEVKRYKHKGIYMLGEDGGGQLDILSNDSQTRLLTIVWPSMGQGNSIPTVSPFIFDESLALVQMT